MKKGLGLYMLGFFCGVLAVRFYDYHFMKTASFKADPLLLQSSRLIRKYGYGDESRDGVNLRSNEYKNPPFSYFINIDSFNTLLTSQNSCTYISNSFSVGCYKWNFIVYPHGNKNDEGDGFISFYITLDSSTFKDNPDAEIYAYLKFYIYHNKTGGYFIIQDQDLKKFTKSNNTWGFSQVISLERFIDLKNGFLFDGDQCQFGVDVIIPKPVNSWEHFTVIDTASKPQFTWYLHNFSTLHNDNYSSNQFSLGGRNWYLLVYPNNTQPGWGNVLAVYIVLGDNSHHYSKHYEKIYASVYIRIVNQLDSEHLDVEVPIEDWFEGPGDGYGKAEPLITLGELNDPERGFLVDDTLKFEVIFFKVSSTIYFP